VADLKTAFRLILILLLAAGPAGCSKKKGETAKMTHLPGRFPVRVIAHRGFSGAAPENTLTAFRKAIEAGSDMIELDVHLSLDGEVVVIHDETLERTTDGKGRAADRTLAELKRLEAGSFFGPDFAGEKIPTLKEALHLAKGRIPVNIEIKTPSHRRYSAAELAEKALQEVRNAAMLEAVLFSSFNPAALDRIARKEPKAMTALLFHRAWNALEDIPGAGKFAVLNLRNIHLTREKVAEVRRAGKIIHVYTVNAEEELRRFVDWGVQGIITNYPDRLIRILQER
jgi:glycerophosphoryl diester phosphodiesterase